MKISIITSYFFVILSISVHGQHAFMHTNFQKADSIAALYPRHSLKDLKALSNKLTEPLLTEEEKFRAIYKWVCNNIEYDYSLYIMNKQRKKKVKNQKELNAWNKEFTSRVFKNLLYRQKTICTGFAYLVKELSSYAGFPCVIVDGYGRTVGSNIGGRGDVNHSWNAIQLNKKWYLCDATWSSGAYDAELMKYEKKFNESYFLSDPALFIRNHYPLDSTWTLLNKKPTLDEFLNRPLIYSNAFKYKIGTVYPETFDVTVAKGKTVSFQFTADAGESIETAKLYCKELNTNEIFKPALRTDNTSVQKKYSYQIDHTFSTRGKHVVHILLNQSFAFTYTVNVR
jgi:transglutaminase/protease-like cytokinesis protein 3